MTQKSDVVSLCEIKEDRTDRKQGRRQGTVLCLLSPVFPPKRVTLSGSDLLKNNNKQKDISKNRNKKYTEKKQKEILKKQQTKKKC